MSCRFVWTWVYMGQWLVLLVQDESLVNRPQSNPCFPGVSSKSFRI